MSKNKTVTEAPAVEIVEEVSESIVRETSLFPMTYLQIDPPAQINILVGNPEGGGWGVIDKQLGIVRGEWNELVKNVQARNYPILADDIGDLLFTVIGFAYGAGMLPQVVENFHSICASQYTKFDRTAADAQETRAKYERKNMIVHTEEVVHEGVKYFVCKASVDQPDPDREGDIIVAGKWLKSVNFKEPHIVLPSEEIQARFKL